MANALGAIGFAGDNRLDAAFLEKRAKSIGVIPLVGHQLRDAGDQADAGLGHHAVGGVTRCQHERPWTALFVDNCVNFAVVAAFGDADRLRLGPPFPPPAQRWVFT